MILFNELFRIILRGKKHYKIYPDWTAKNSRKENLYLKNVLSIWPKKSIIEKIIEQAGTPYGLTFSKYVTWKILASIIFFTLFGLNKSFLIAVFYLTIGFFTLDIILIIKVRLRQEKIRQELPYMIETIIRYLKTNIPLIDVFHLLSKHLRGPLQEEVIKLTANYQITGNLQRGLDDFSNRIGMVEIENLCLALRQGELSGKMLNMLNKQAEILNKYFYFKTFKTTKNRANFLPLITVAMVINILLLTVVPMVLVIVSSGKLF